MKKHFAFTLLVPLFISCSGSSDHAKETGTQKPTDTVTPMPINNLPVVKECYAKISGKDSVFVQLTISGDSLTGTMTTNYYGKDKNSGAFTGSIKNDTIIADYLFMSEGVQSVRQIAFLKKDSSLIEGFADVQEKDAKMVFRNAGKIKFDNKNRLGKTACK